MAMEAGRRRRAPVCSLLSDQEGQGAGRGPHRCGRSPWEGVGTREVGTTVLTWAGVWAELGHRERWSRLCVATGASVPGVGVVAIGPCPAQASSFGHYVSHLASSFGLSLRLWSRPAGPHDCDSRPLPRSCLPLQTYTHDKQQRRVIHPAATRRGASGPPRPPPTLTPSTGGEEQPW